MNSYQVWVKSQKATTETTIKAGHKTLALIKLASLHGLKSYQCDGRLLHRDVNRKSR